MRTLWQRIGSSEYATDKAINLHCLATNALEGIIMLSPSVGCIQGTIFNHRFIISTVGHYYSSTDRFRSL